MIGIVAPECRIGAEGLPAVDDLLHDPAVILERGGERDNDERALRVWRRARRWCQPDRNGPSLASASPRGVTNIFKWGHNPRNPV